MSKSHRYFNSHRFASPWADHDILQRCFDITLVPGHLVLLKHRPSYPHMCDLNIWSIRALLACRSPDAALSKVKPIVSKGIDISSVPNPKIYLESCISPLRDGFSTVWAVVLSYPDQSVEPRTIIHKFHVSHPRSQRLSIVSLSSWKLGSGIYKPGTTPDTLRLAFTGYLPTCFESETEVGIVSLPSARATAFVIDDYEGVALNKVPFLSPYGGTAICRSKNLQSVVIHQYT